MEDSVQRLRERGIYALPDGSEFVVHATFRGEYVLYTHNGWEFLGRPHAFKLDAPEEVGLYGQPAGWSPEDLTDTTRTAGHRSVLESPRKNSSQLECKTGTPT